MKVRKESTENFYETVKLWWSKHRTIVNGEQVGFPVIHKAFLPQNVFVATNDKGDDTYCCFFYETDSALAWLAYPTSNTDVSKEDREGGLEFLFHHMENYARMKGYFLLFTTSDTPNVEAALINKGFMNGDKGVNQYLKPLS